MSLQTGKAITPPNFTLCKKTKLVAEAVERHSRKEGGESLKLFNRKMESLLLPPIDLLTGVGGESSPDSDSDYAPISPYDESYSEESYSSSDDEDYPPLVDHIS